MPRRHTHLHPSAPGYLPETGALSGKCQPFCGILTKKQGVFWQVPAPPAPKCSPCPIPWDTVRVFPPKPFTVSPTLGRGARFPHPPLRRITLSLPVAPNRIHTVTPPHRHRSNFTPTTCNAQSASHHPPPPFQRHRSPASNSTCYTYFLQAVEDATVRAADGDGRHRALDYSMRGNCRSPGPPRPLLPQRLFTEKSRVRPTG